MAEDWPAVWDRQTGRQPAAQRCGETENMIVKEEGDEQGRRRVGTTPWSKLALYERYGRRIRYGARSTDGSDSIDDVAIGSCCIDTRPGPARAVPYAVRTSSSP